MEAGDRRRGRADLDVADTRPDQLAEVDREWHRLATRHRVLDEDGRFLVSLPGPGAGTAPWRLVRLTPASSLAEHLAERPGHPDFVTAAISQPVVLAVSSEEYGIWLILDGGD